MGYEIVKDGKKFLVWSTVVDKYVYESENIEEVIDYLVESAIESPLGDLNTVFKIEGNRIEVPPEEKSKDFWRGFYIGYLIETKIKSRQEFESGLISIPMEEIKKQAEETVKTLNDS